MGKMEQKRFEFVLRAETPIAHHAETVGNQAISFRRKVRTPNGGWAHVPVVTADTCRHGLREAIAYAFLDAAGMLSDPSLSEAALRLLFAGGMVTGRGSGDASTVKLDDYREMCELIPGLALLGGCASNRVIPGRLMVEDALLICNESRHLLPTWVVDYVEQSAPLDTCRAHIELEQRVRMDPTLDPGKRKLLSAGAASDTENRLLQSEAAHDDDIATAREATKSTMLPRSFERIASGSLFSWAVEATCYSDLDVDCFLTMVAAFLANAKVGGKKGTGHGTIKPVTARGVVVSSPSERLHPMDTTELAGKAGSLFRQHVTERRDRIRSFLGAVNA
ncbi:MAG TPA: hypothetical protein VFU97_24370 [Xanthobacteraceae bacterium]|nr:hypothetical protein [Xanthobacteraceae bacterium]